MIKVDRGVVKIRHLFSCNDKVGAKTWPVEIPHTYS